MKEIGGYFELELQKGNQYHKNAIKLNTARNCLMYILKEKEYNKIYIPYFTCDAVLEPILKLSIPYEFYFINKDLEPTRIIKLNQGEAFLYTNYFGLKQSYVDKLKEVYKDQLIIDNAQAFFSNRIGGVDTFYSARKFFGVPDGAYLYTDSRLNSEIPDSYSFNKMLSLLKRIDISAEDGYTDFINNEKSLKEEPIKKMSKLTEAILSSIDYDSVNRIRKENYQLFDKYLSKENSLDLVLGDQIPMVYPLLTENYHLRKKLIKNKIYIPTYWPNVFSWTNKNMFEYTLTQQILPLPIDQRYNKEDLLSIIKILIS